MDDEAKALSEALYAMVLFPFPDESIEHVLGVCLRYHLGEKGVW